MKPVSQDQRYLEIADAYGPALERLARAFEANTAERRDLLQEIHFAVWRSLAVFDGRCSLRTWVYRVAHNTAASHVSRSRRMPKGVSIDDLILVDGGAGPEQITGDKRMLDKLTATIRALAPPDRQVMLLYLEDLDAAAIGEITGMSPGAVATKIHRIKALLAKRFQGGGNA